MGGREKAGKKASFCFLLNSAIETRNNSDVWFEMNWGLFYESFGSIFGHFVAFKDPVSAV